MGKFNNFAIYMEELKDKEEARKMADKYKTKKQKMIVKRYSCQKHK